MNGTRRVFLSGILGVMAASAGAQTTFSQGHVDIGIAYEDGAWDLHVHTEEPPPGQEFEPGEAVLQLGVKAQLPGGVPNTPAATGFFGAAGSPLWVLPKTEDPDLPFLGIGTEELSAEDWNGPLSLRLRDVRGPGDVFVWDVGAFGDLQPKMSSRDGFSSTDTLGIEAASHGHYFWAFSAPGDYEVVLSASGVHTVDGAIESDPVAYRFQVVPEPGVVALFVLGGLGLAGMGRRRVEQAGGLRRNQSRIE